jgi:hypothetical protein
MVATWADRPDYEGPRSKLVTCPCCGRQRAADMIIYVGDRRATTKRASRERLAARLRWRDMPDYICSAELSRIHREKLVEDDELPGRR